MNLALMDRQIGPGKFLIFIPSAADPTKTPPSRKDD